MKKIITLALCAILALSALPGCKKSSGGVVNVYNWGEYVDESIFDTFKAETGITVNYTTYETNEQLFSQLELAGSAAEYDVIIPSDYMLSRLIELGKLEKIDFANVPNFSLIGEQFRNMPYDPTNEYSVPYTWGTVGIIYNTAMIDEELTSWGAMFDPAYKDAGIVMFDNPRDAFGIALKYLGFSLNTTDESEIQAAYELLKQQSGILQKYVTDDIFLKMEGGNAAIGVYYAGDFLTMYENNEDLAFAVPQEGSNVFVDAMCIPKGAKNKANAEAFINFMCSTETALANMDETWYVSANTEAAEQWRAELDDEIAEGVLFPNDDVLGRCETFINLPEATLALYDRLWVQIKS
ncbi:MAG: spermidine/putrescine ABC transporter substrate-binding protein [Oscillospiraceae bacterium]|jgi:spermidine/putrescine transport system substrate-binding protein|nr:spermidine/putrescine ABC transporter substrate-binding protein [Oscillospiraceae bacterium]